MIKDIQESIKRLDPKSSYIYNGNDGYAMVDDIQNLIDHAATAKCDTCCPEALKEFNRGRDVERHQTVEVLKGVRDGLIQLDKFLYPYTSSNLQKQLTAINALIEEEE